MKKIIHLIICGLVFSVLQLNATDIYSVKFMPPTGVVSYFATTQIVCPLNATSFPSSIDVPVKITGFNKIISSGGSISWDTSVIKYSYISNNGSSTLGVLNLNVSPSGYLTFNWNDSKQKGVTISDSTLFFTLRFSIIGSFGKVSPITLSNNPVAYFSQDSSLRSIPTLTINGSVILTTGSNVTISSAQTFCQGDSDILTSSVGVNYQWYLNGSPIQNASNQSYHAYNTGTYYVLTTIPNGCNTYSNNISLTAIPAPSTPIITSGNISTTLCSGNSIVLTSSSENSYQWFLNGTAISGGNSQSYTATTTGNYTVITINSTGCKSISSAATKVTFNSTPTTPVISSKGSVNICSNSYDTLTCSPGNGYQWYFNGNAINGATNQSIYINNTGVYTATVSNGSCLSNFSNSLTININAISQPVINTLGSVNLCQGSSVLLSSNTIYSYYQWLLNGSPINGANNQSYTAVTAGSYTLQAGTLGGCTLISSPVIISTVSTVNPTINTGSTTTFCSGGSVLLTCNNSSYSTYQWMLNGNAIPNATGQSYTASSTGIYTVNTSNFSGCSSLSATGISITVNSSPAVPSITTIGSTNLCFGSSLTLISSSAYNYQWYNNGIAINNASTQTNIVSNAGSYTVAVANSNGCTATSLPVVINVITKTTPVINVGGNTSFCQGGSVQLNVGSVYTSYQWYLNNNIITGATTQSYLANATGSYTVTGITSDGCTSNSSSVLSINVNNNPTTPMLSITGSTTLCAGNNLTLNSSVEYSYSWYLNGILLNTTTNPNLSIATAGTYKVVTTNSAGCTSAASNTISITVITPVTPVISVSGNTSICNGDSVLLTSSSGSSYQWYLNGISINSNNTQSIYAKINGNYSVMVTYPSGCSASSASTIISVYVTPTPFVTNNNNIICSGSNVVLSANTGYNSYQWYYGSIPVASANNSSYAATATGSYTVVGTNSYGCKSAQSTPVTLTMSAAVVSPSISTTGNTSFCSGGSVILSGSNNGYSRYQWYLNGNSITNATAQSYTTTQAGVYTVSATNNTGCTSGNSSPVLVTVYPVASTPVIYSSTGSDSICYGNYIVLSTSMQKSYQWYMNGIPLTNVTGQFYTVNTTGNYSVQVTNNNGCNSISAITTISVLPKPTPVITTSGSTSFCKGNSVQLSTNGYYTYQWYLNGVAIPGAVDSTYTADSSGNYSVSATTYMGCVSNISLNVLVNVFSNPAAPVLSVSNSTICYGYNTTILSTPGASYSWYLNGALLNTSNSSGFTVSSAGVYKVITTNQNGCNSPLSNPIYITVITPVNPVISVSGSTTICNGDSVLLTSSLGISYQWYLNGIILNNSNTQSIYAKLNGKYSVNVTYSSGCSASSTSTTISIFNTPTPLISNNYTIICPGSNIVLSAGAGYSSYQWYYGNIPVTGANISSYAAAAAGSYTVAGINSYGCTSMQSSSVILTMSAVVVAPSISTTGNTSFCPGGYVVLSSSNIGYSSFQWYLNGNIISNSTAESYTAIQAGFYTVTATNNAGCISGSSSPVSVTVYPAASTPVLYSSTGSDSICYGNNIVLSTSLQNNYQWYLNGIPLTNASNQFYIANSAGNYSVQITNKNGCSSVSAINTITLIPKSTPVITASGNTSICKGNSVQLNTAGYYTYQWYLNGVAVQGATDSTFTADSSGNYTVIGTTYLGCVSNTSSIISVTVFYPPSTPVLTVSNNSICSGNSTTLISTTGTTYAWYQNGNLLNTTSTSGYSISSAGNYSVVTTNRNGCKSAISNTVNISVITPVSTIISISGNTSFCLGDSVILTTSAGNTYNWYKNGISISNSNYQNYTAISNGNYTVMVTFPTGCAALSDTVTVTAYQTPTPVIAYNKTIICQGGNLTMSVDSSYNSFQWYINNFPVSGAVNNTYSATIAGNYTVITTSIMGCTSAASLPVQLTLSSNPATPVITATASTFCKGDSVTLMSSAGYNYQWYNNNNVISGARNIIYHASQPGNYSVVVFNAAGCSSASSSYSNIAQYPYNLPIINPNGSTSICSGNSVILTSSQDSLYQWYMNNISLTNNTNQTFTATSTGTYKVKVTDSYGCKLISDTISVNVESVTPPVITNTGKSSICSVDSTILLANSGYANYQWYLNGILITGANNISLTATASGNYTVTGNSISGCLSSASSAVTINVYNIPSKPTISAPSNGLCDGGNIVLTGNLFNNGTYQWYLNGNPITGANNQTYTAYAGGIYSLVITNAGSCSSVISNNFIITSNSTTPVINVNGNTIICSGASSLLTASSGIGYQWYMNNAAIAGANSQNYYASTGGTYTVAVTNNNNCTSTTTGIAITLNPVTTPTLTSSATTVCKGNTITLTASTGFAYYQWYNNGIVIPGITTISYTATVSGNYTVTGTTAAGCTSPASLLVPLNIMTSAPIPVITTANPNICLGNSATLTSSTALAYQWYLNGVAINNANNQTYYTTTQGNYSVSITDTNGCKSNTSQSITVNILSIPSAPSISANGNTTICSNGNVTLSSTPANAYQWYLNGTLITGGTSQTLNVSAAGYYSVQVFNFNYCSATSSSFAIKSVSSRLPVITASGATTFCSGNTVTLTASADSGYTLYQWYNNGTLIIGATGNTFSVNTSGAYTVIASTIAGCASIASLTTIVTVNNAPSIPVISPAGKSALCKNSVLTLSAPAASSYQWYKNGTIINGAVNQTYSASDSGSYSLLVYNTGGCSIRSSLNTQVWIDTNTVAIANITKTTFCKGDSVILKATAGFTYQWLNNSTIITVAQNQNYTVTKSGSYSVYAVDSNNCNSSYGNIVINVISSNAPSVFINGPVTFCSGIYNTTLNAVPGLSYYQWYRNDTIIQGATSVTYIPTSTGTYTLVAYNTGDCASSPSNPVGITVIQTPTKPVIASTGGSTICNGKNILLISSAGSAYQWYRNSVLLIGATSQTYNATNTGYYSVQSINYGCNSAFSDSFVIQKTVNPGFTVNASTQEICGNNFAFTSTTPSSVNKYYWDFGDGSKDYSINPIHSYSSKGTFTVKQIITSSNYTCIDSTSQQVVVTKCSYNGVSEQDSVNVYPNPNKGIFKVNILSEVARNARIALIGAETGIIFFTKDIQLQEGKNIFNFDLSSPVFKRGVYIVRVIGDNIAYTVKRFVLMR